MLLLDEIQQRQAAATVPNALSILAAGGRATNRGKYFETICM